MRDAIARDHDVAEQLRRSLTWDRGADKAQHARLRVDTGFAIYLVIAVPDSGMTPLAMSGRHQLAITSE